MSILRAKKFQDEENMKEQLAKAAEEGLKENLEAISSERFLLFYFELIFV